MTSYLGHGLVIGFLLRVCPVNDNITAPDLDAASFESAFGQTGSFVRLVFKKTESSEKIGQERLNIINL